MVDCDDDCPLDVLDDSDLDGSCDSDDICPGFDDNIDTDDDELSDSTEVNNCDYGEDDNECTDPNIDDSDGDTINDGE